HSHSLDIERIRWDYRSCRSFGFLNSNAQLSLTRVTNKFGCGIAEWTRRVAYRRQLLQTHLRSGSSTLELGFTSHGNRFRLPWAISPESSIEHIALGIGEHEIAFLHAGWEKFRETFTHHTIW